MMFQILKKFLLVFLCLFLLSSFVFASAEPSPSVVVQWNIKLGNSNHSGSFTIDGASPSSSESGIGIISFTSGSVSVDNSASSTTVFQLSPVSANFSASTSSKGFSVSSSVSNGVATISVLSSADRSSNICGIDFSDSGVTITQSSFSASGYSFTSSGGSIPEPDDPYSGTGSMFGWTGKTIFGLQTNSMEKWYIDGTGDARVGHLDATYNYADAVSVPGYWVMQNMVASLTVQKWQWQIKPESGLPVFNVDETYKGTWSDMIYRTSVYNYFWGNKLWNNDVSGSWYGSISSDFSYLNFRVNQILDVLANDEDLAIKDSTTSEREWIKDYFSGSGDKADSDKYDKLNNTGSAFKDAFAGAPDSSIADGFTAINDNGYDFWSQAVSDDINGNNLFSSGASRAPDYIPPEQRIVDAYSENWAQIVGGYYD